MGDLPTYDLTHDMYTFVAKHEMRDFAWQHLNLYCDKKIVLGKNNGQSQNKVYTLILSEYLALIENRSGYVQRLFIRG